MPRHPPCAPKRLTGSSSRPLLPPPQSLLCRARTSGRLATRSTYAPARLPRPGAPQRACRLPRRPRTHRAQKSRTHTCALPLPLPFPLNPTCQISIRSREMRVLGRSIEAAVLDLIAQAPTGPLQKGGDPAAGSPTATLLRLRPSHEARLRLLPPRRITLPGWVTGFGRSPLPWRDGRCVQGPGTYSPGRS